MATVSQQESPTTIAILSGNPLVNRIIGSLLEGFGYEIRLLDEAPNESNEQIFKGVDLVLLGPTISDGFQRAFLSFMRSTPQTASIPVLTLTTALEETLAGKSGFVMWPCRIEDLARHIEAALRAVVSNKMPHRGDRHPLSSEDARG